MGEQTKVSWCDSTWNPVIGCSFAEYNDGSVRSECEHCYAKDSTPANVSRKCGLELWGKGHTRRMTSVATLDATHRWNKKPWICEACGKAFSYPQQHECPTVSKVFAFPDETNWHRRRVFLGSLMDLWEPWARVVNGDTTVTPVEARAVMLDTIRTCPELDFLCCSKRWHLWLKVMNEVEDWCGKNQAGDLGEWCARWRAGQAPANVWGLSTMGTQKAVDETMLDLISTPLAVRGISCEPILERVNFGFFGTIPKSLNLGYHLVGGMLHWLIVGGESNTRTRHARPCNVRWLRDAISQGQAAQIPVFMKQVGSNPIDTEKEPLPPEQIDGDGTAHWWTLDYIKHPKGGDPEEWPTDLRVREFPEVSR